MLRKMLLIVMLLDEICLMLVFIATILLHMSKFCYNNDIVVFHDAKNPSLSDLSFHICHMEDIFLIGLREISRIMFVSRNFSIFSHQFLHLKTVI